MKIFYLPDLGEGLAEAEIREWYVKAGDTVKVDQPLVSMETAKAVVDVPSPYAGKILELHGKVNDIIQTGAPFISFAADEATADKGSVVGKLETSEKNWDDGQVMAAVKTSASSVKALPAARRLASERQIDLSLVPPTGPQGLITTEDVKRFMAQHADKTPTFSGKEEGQTETLHGVRRTMAQVMSQSHREVVPVTIIEDADITDLPPKSDITARMLQAIVQAARAEPSLNAWFDGKTVERILFDKVHIGLAVDTDEGLFVPVIKDAETKSPEALRQTIDTYKQSVSTRSISAADMQGATITLSNFGMIAGRYATPIIIPPAVAILGCGRSREVALPKAGQIVARRLMPLSLTFDHRAVTGGEATRFLKVVIQCLEGKG